MPKTMCTLFFPVSSEHCINQIYLFFLLVKKSTSVSCVKANIHLSQMFDISGIFQETLIVLSFSQKIHCPLWNTKVHSCSLVMRHKHVPSFPF
jgi:hypothetical protein